jgi:hypothetical protein
MTSENVDGYSRWSLDVPDEFKNLDKEDSESRQRWEYEKWELEQTATGLPRGEWSPFVPSEVKRKKRLEKENKAVVRNLKKPKEETGREKWERLEEERGKKEIKKVVRMAKKMRKEGKMKRIDSYFKK